MNEGRVSDLTVSELKALIRETVRETILEIEQESIDPDEGAEFKPEIAERLRNYLKDRPKGRPAADVYKELGLDV
ncbi:MAG: hypothetical protein IT324_25650 [Anaerolineae bacterium]|nr:hypothetical protein [Anaerolineae bacterium]